MMRWLLILSALGCAAAQQIDYPTQVTRVPAVDARTYLFTRTNGASASGDLSSPGSGKSVTVTRCPTGLNGTDTFHYIYVSGGTGTAEPVLITGGSCTSGASSGTIIFTTANAHSGAWSLSSATCGNNEAIWALSSAGGTIQNPAGTCVVRGPIAKRAVPIYIEGMGEDVTIWQVAATGFGHASNFPLSVCGVFCIPDDTALLNSLTDSGGVSDLTISFYQSQTATALSDLVHWPPAFNLTNQNRFAVSRVKWQLAWDGLRSLCCNGVYLTNVKSSAYHRGIDLDQQYDSSRIVGFHSWPFGATGISLSKLFIFDPAVVGFYIGQADDTKIIGCASDAGTSVDIHDTATGAAWVVFDACEFDTGRFNVHSPLGAKVWVSNTLFNAQVDIPFNGVTSSFNFDYTGNAEVFFSNTTFGTANEIVSTIPISINFSTTGSAADITLSAVRFSNCRFFLSLRDVDLIKVFSTTTYTGTMQIANSKFLVNQSLGAVYASAMIDAVGPVKVIATGNTVNDKAGNTGAWFKADTDSGHDVTGNSAIGWSITYPTDVYVSNFANNTGIINPIAVSSTVASASTIIPSGRFFHISGTANISTVTPYISVRFTPFIANHDFYAVADAAWATVTGGNIANAITAAAGQLVHFMYDTGTSKYSVSQ